MKETVSTKSNNMPLQQFRVELNQQRKFLKKFYTPIGLQAKTKTEMAAIFVLWLFLTIFLVSNKSNFSKDIFNLLLLASAASFVAHYIAYNKHK